MLAGLSFFLGVAGFVFNGPEKNPETSPATTAMTKESSTPATAGTGLQAGAAMPIDIGAVASLKPHFVGVLEYVKRRYRVSPEAVLPVFEVAELIGQERRIDPLLILAIIGVESGFNPFAESSMGARGLMQVIPRFHMDKVPEGMGVRHLFDPAVNIQVGVRVLEEAIRRRGGLTAGLQYYAGSSESASRYANTVLAEKARLEKAARGTQPPP
jgi:soluble lytic murein transglycosylase-like protein